jgi:hypothetical protein
VPLRTNPPNTQTNILGTHRRFSLNRIKLEAFTERDQDGEGAQKEARDSSYGDLCLCFIVVVPL